MRENALRGIWQQGGAALGGWLTVPSAMSAEIFANCGFDWVCVDMQHGLIDEADMIRMLQGISSTETVPLVRVPRNEAGIIGKCLDAGRGASSCQWSAPGRKRKQQWRHAVTRPSAYAAMVRDGRITTQGSTTSSVRTMKYCASSWSRPAERSPTLRRSFLCQVWTPSTSARRI